jgi:hypothetical protein
MAQAPEVVESDHFQVWPGECVRQLHFFSSGFVSTNPETRGWLRGRGLATACRRARQALPACVGLLVAKSAGLEAREEKPKQVPRYARNDNALALLVGEGEEEEVAAAGGDYG